MIGFITLVGIIALIVIVASLVTYWIERTAKPAVPDPCPEGWGDDRSTCECVTCHEARIRAARYHGSDQWGR